MHIGLHFGKRKPVWKGRAGTSWKTLLDTSEDAFRYALVLTLIQIVVLSPILYWTLENYSFFISNSPKKSPLRMHFENEQFWIVGLFFLMTILSFLANSFYIKNIISKLSPNEPSEYLRISETVEPALPGATDGQYRAS